MKNIVFIPIPRNASGSITDAIEEKGNFYCFEKGHSYSEGDPPNPCNDAKGSSWYFAKENLEKKNISWDDCKKFTVLRNPWSRVVSMYHHDHANPLRLDWPDFLRSLSSLMLGRLFGNEKTKETEIPFYQKITDPIPFKYKHWRCHPDVAKFQHHVLPQVYHFFGDNHQSVLDYIIDFDSLQLNFDNFMDDIGEPRIVLGHNNYSGDAGKNKSFNNSYRDFYTEDWMVKLIASLYRHDVMFGKYTF